MTTKKPKTPEQKEACRLLNKFKDLVAIDYRYDEKPYFSNQQACAIIVCEESLKTATTVAARDRIRRVISAIKAEKPRKYNTEYSGS